MNDSYQEEVFALRDENARLEAAIRAKDAALRAAMSHFGLAAWIVHAQRFPKTTREEVKVVQQMQAALSDHAGEGWLSPEVREQVRAALVLARRRLHPRSASYIVAEVDKAIAALDALKGAE